MPHPSQQHAENREVFARQIAHALIGDVAKLPLVQERIHILALRAPATQFEFRGNRRSDGLGIGQVVEALEQPQADAPMNLAGAQRHPVPEDDELAACEQHPPGQREQQRGLTRAVASAHSEHLPLLHFEGNAAEGHSDQVLQLQALRRYDARAGRRRRYLGPAFINLLRSKHLCSFLTK